MEQIKLKLDVIQAALKTLKESIELFDEYKKVSIVGNDKRLFLATRDSVIQRFEYCTDLFWKVLKIYLEDVEKVTLTTFSPRSIIRESAVVRILSESESEACMDMIKNRNETSHIYHQEVAQEIVSKVPAFYVLMQTIVTRIVKKS